MLPPFIMFTIFILNTYRKKNIILYKYRFFTETAASFLRLIGERDRNNLPSERRESLDNGASSYRRFLDGDDEGIAEIVGDYKDGLMLYLNSLVKNIHTAEELTEDTFFRILMKKPRFSGKSSFKSWLYAIGRNVAVDYIRNESKCAAIPIEDMESYLCDEYDLERSYIREERRIMVHRALDKLPSDYRQILWLVYFEDLSNEEASIVMKKNARQIRNLLYRAKQSMKSELEKEGFIYEEF